MSTVITRRLEIDAGHRLPGHESKCRNVHGHRYVFEIACTAPDLDAVGRIIDFSVIKAKVGAWLDDNWDHAFIAQEGDPLIDFLVANDQKHQVVPWPPTAENLAKMLFITSSVLLGPHGVTVVAVTCHETPNCQATFRVDDDQ